MIASRAPRSRILAAFGLVLALALGLSTAAAKGTAGSTLSLWRVSDSAGHVMYLAGSMHALTEADMPLPKPFTTAFQDSDRLVEELNLPDLDPATVSQQALQMGVMQDTTLEKVMGKADWAKVQKLAGESNVALYHYEHFKPWLAAIGIADTLLLRLGYKPQLGLDMHFAQLAKKRNMASNGLETVAEQLSFFNDLPLSVQKHFLLQTLEQASTAKEDLSRLHDAWALGDVSALESLMNDNFKGFEHVRKILIDDRNRRWLPHLKQCLASNQTCFVAVGVQHMVGPAGLLALLRHAGDTVTQMHDQTALTTGN